MASERDRDKPRKLPKQTSSQGDVPLKPAGEAVVKHEETAAKPPAGKQIHQRRPLPLIPEKGAEPGSENQKEEGTASRDG